MNEPPPVSHIAGVILAGGKSSRFGGNKALADLDGRSLIAHAAGIVQSVFQHCLLVANDPQPYAFLNWPIIADRLPGKGPLAGIQAALHAIPEDYAFICACDMPFLDQRLLRYLCAQTGDWDAVVPWPTSGPEPLHAIYRKSALTVIDRHLQSGKRAIAGIFPELSIRAVTEKELLQVVPDLAAFANINRPTDLTGYRS